MAKITGGDRFRRDLKKLEQDTRGGVVRALEVAGLEMLDEATQRCPVDFGTLRQGLGIREDNANLRVYLYNNVKYAPYVEFGVGPLVSVPPELVEIAIQFKGSGKTVYGIRAQPYMYPGLQKGRAVFTKQIALLVKSVNIRK